MFYEPITEHKGFTLVSRPDTDNYYITWCKPGSRRYRRKSTGTSDLDEAKQLLKDFAERWGRAGAAKPEDALILDLLSDYIERKRQTANFPATLFTGFKHLTEFCNTHDLATVDELTMSVIEGYHDWRRERLLANNHGASNGTINRELVVLRAALRDAWKRGKLTEAPFIPLLPSPPPRERFLTQDEAKHLLNACEHEHLRLFVLMALHTLQRPIALFQLRVEQIDLDRNRIDFLPAGSTQSNKRRPVVPITRTLRPELEQAITHSVSGHVLEWQGRPIKSVKNTFNQARDRAGLGRDVTPYVLRHTGATLMAGAGVPLRQIAGMLGHSHTKTTEIYAKHQPEYLVDARDALDDLFGAPNARQETGCENVKPWQEKAESLGLSVVGLG